MSNVPRATEYMSPHMHESCHVSNNYFVYYIGSAERKTTEANSVRGVTGKYDGYAGSDGSHAHRARSSAGGESII